MNYPVLIIVLFAALCGWLLLMFLIPHLRSLFLDKPNDRSSHILPIPRGGGISFCAVSAVSSVIALFVSDLVPVVAFLPLLAAPLGFVGLLDDRYKLPASWRYGVQLLTAMLILGFSPLVQRLGVALSSSIWLFLPICPAINVYHSRDQLHQLHGWARRSVGGLYGCDHLRFVNCSFRALADMVTCWFSSRIYSL